MDPVVAMAVEDAAHLGPWRTRRGWQVALSGGDLWLRVPASDEEGQRVLRGLACRRRFEVDAEGRLFRPGRRLPVERLPSGMEWCELASFLQPTGPTSVRPAEAPAPVRLTPERTAAPVPAMAALLSLAAWKAYAERAPEVRLRRWRFAAAEDGRVLVLGRPLPPLPHRPLVAAGPWLLPAGFGLPQAGDAERLASRAGLSHGDYGLMQADGSWERVPAEAVMAASRSAIRTTVAAGDETP